MKKMQSLFAVCGSLAGILAGAFVLCTPVSGRANVVKRDTCSVQLNEAAAETTGITADLLTEEGQYVLLRTVAEERQIPISIQNSRGLSWTSVAVSSDSARLEAELHQEASGGEEGEEILYLTLKPTESAEGETVSEETASDETASESGETAPETEGADPAAEEGSDTENENIKHENTEAGAEETAASVVCIEVTLTYCEEEGEAPRTLSAVFAAPIGQTGEDGSSPAGTLKRVPGQYDPSVPLLLVNGDEESELQLKEGDFPPMTRYTMREEGKTYLLYDGGAIRIPAKAEVFLDLSQTKGENETDADTAEEEKEKSSEDSSADRKLILRAGDAAYPVQYAKAPKLLKADAPYIMEDGELVLPLSYKWGDLEPTISIEKLGREEKQPVWEEAAGIAWEDRGAELLLKAQKEAAPEAGTYQLTLSWTENDVTLYTVKAVFYVRYAMKG